MPETEQRAETLTARELHAQEIAAHLEVIGDPAARGGSLDHGWLIAELTDGCLVGIRDHGGDWVLSGDEFPTHSPGLTNTGTQWRVRDVHIFNPTEYIHLTGSDEGPVRGWQLSAAPAPDQPDWLRPRDAHLLITAGSDTSEQLTEDGGHRLPPGVYRGDRFARVITPSGSERIVPGPFADAPIPHTRLHVRQYFTQHPGGAVGAHAVRYLAITPATTVEEAQP